MKRCTVCGTKVYRSFEEHVKMHQAAARRRELRKHPERYPRVFRASAMACAPAMESAELVGVGTEVTIPRSEPSFWQKIRNFFGFGS